MNFLSIFFLTRYIFTFRKELSGPRVCCPDNKQQIQSTNDHQWKSVVSNPDESMLLSSSVDSSKFRPRPQNFVTVQSKTKLPIVQQPNPMPQAPYNQWRPIIRQPTPSISSHGGYLVPNIDPYRHTVPTKQTSPYRYAVPTKQNSPTSFYYINRDQESVLPSPPIFNYIPSLDSVTSTNSTSTTTTSTSTTTTTTVDPFSTTTTQESEKKLNDICGSRIVTRIRGGTPLQVSVI